jgi:hypothetical protein
MLSKLTEQETTLVRNHYNTSGNPLFLALDEVFTKRAAYLEGLDIGVEEVFLAVAQLLDKLFNTEVSQQDVDKLWTELFNDIRKIKIDATKHDKQQVTHTIFAIVRKLLCHHWKSLYCDTLYDMLGETIKREMRNSDNDELAQFEEGLFEHSEALSEWINNVYEGNLGADIETLLKGNKNDSSEDEDGSSYDVLNDRLNETKIVQTIKDTQRHDLGQIDFSFAVHNVLESLNWLNDTMDTHFMAWMKSQGIIKIMTKNLKKAKSNLNTQKVEKELKNTFQTINPDTGNPMDKLEFYKRKDAKLINNGK